jgi:N-acetylmuramoyl-L-alanine amidase CwlA
MCVNKGYDYEKAFQNTVKLTRYLMKSLGIPADRVFQHYDICSKDCPSQIRKHGDWNRFKQLISAEQDNTKAANTFLKAVKAVADKAKAEK